MTNVKSYKWQWYRLGRVHDSIIVNKHGDELSPTISGRRPRYRSTCPWTTKLTTPRYNAQGQVWMWYWSVHLEVRQCKSKNYRQGSKGYVCIKNVFVKVFSFSLVSKSHLCKLLIILFGYFWVAYWLIAKIDKLSKSNKLNWLNIWKKKKNTV